MKPFVLIVAILAVATAIQAATWHVAQDGTGDFTVIQDAVDAASPGDVIRVHAGRYGELTQGVDVWGNGNVIADVHVYVTKDDLTIIGDGSDATIIGPEEFPDITPSDYYYGICVTDNYAHSLQIEGVGFELPAVYATRESVFAASDTFAATNCRFTGANGIKTFVAEGVSIIYCEFENCWQSILCLTPTSNVDVLNCTFEDCNVGTSFVSTTDATVANCSFNGGSVCIDYQQGATGSVSDCSMSGYINYAFSCALGVNIDVSRCLMENGGAGVYALSGTTATFTECVLRNNWWAAFEIWSPLVEVHDCEILNGGEYTVRCLRIVGDDCHVDMTGNYWGTDSQAQIEEWIYDSYDDPELCCTVDFVPFDGPVATEARSWSGVKAIFRGGPE